MMPSRFSKASLRAYLEDKIKSLELEHKFNPRDGWRQVYDRETPVRVAFGEYVAFQRVLEDLDGGYIQ